MGNIRSIREFREALDDNFWDVGVGAEALLLREDGVSALHWASYAKVMDYIAVAFYAKKMFADLEAITQDVSLTEEQQQEKVYEASACLRDALAAIVFKVIDSDEMTEEDTKEMEEEYESIVSNLTEEDE